MRQPTSKETTEETGRNLFGFRCLKSHMAPGHMTFFKDVLLIVPCIRTMFSRMDNLRTIEPFYLSRIEPPSERSPKVPN